jgi:uncharacterized protein
VVPTSPAPGPDPTRGPLFVDTNVFLRFLTNDVPEKAAAVEDLLRRAGRGEVELVTSPMVVAELVWVLESFYRLSRSAVQERALAVVQLDGLTLPETDLLTDALFVYETERVDFIDAYNACWMKQRGLRRAVTFDANHFSRVGWVEVEGL